MSIALHRKFSNTKFFLQFLENAKRKRRENIPSLSNRVMYIDTCFSLICRSSYIHLSIFLPFKMNSLISLPKAMALCTHPRRSSHLLNAMKPTSSFHSFHHAFPSRSPIPTHFIPICKGRSRRNCINGDSQPPGEGEADGDRVLRAVLKLYDAIKDKDIGGLSEVFGDECRFRCNFVPLHQSFKGKKVTAR